MAKPRPTPIGFGVVEPQAIYTKEELLQRVGLRDDGYRAARRNGLRVVEKHRRVFILGSDWIEYVTREDDDDDEDE